MCTILTASNICVCSGSRNLQRPCIFSKPTLSLTAVRFCCQCKMFCNHFLPIEKQNQTLETVCRKGLSCSHPWMCIQPMLQCLAVDFCFSFFPFFFPFYFVNCLKTKEYVHAKDLGLNFKLVPRIKIAKAWKKLSTFTCLRRVLQVTKK